MNVSKKYIELVMNACNQFFKEGFIDIARTIEIERTNEQIKVLVQQTSPPLIVGDAVIGVETGRLLGDGVTDATLERKRSGSSDAPGKRPVRTEINLTLW
ncbi:hypothetical protein FJQ98_26225 [Lysinibacillus agricola]|uniref:Uncharacterized protein n=1 Tax=Lysinibacillus agricola TaxID=2590012 RepID=A0ABX7ASB3_9BACI|nr:MULTISPECIES: hypothetical protein [Lysinibacillus]KOS61106.1 hypothetical protein AN161_19180 [Lysinibacillus sp. FJAT-14222]QQP12521.1 hypothetical protein FJQ98_26225 [Lysinibacillus agricola]